MVQAPSSCVAGSRQSKKHEASCADVSIPPPPKLPPDTTETFTTLFTQTLQVLFDQNWTQSQTESDITQRPVTVITDSIKDVESRAYAVNVSVPSRGSLRAVVWQKSFLRSCRDIN